MAFNVKIHIFFILIGVSSCSRPKSIAFDDLNNKCWYAFDLTTTEGDDFLYRNLGYIELYIWQKEEDQLVTIFYDYEDYERHYELLLEQENANKFNLFHKEGKKFGILLIKDTEEIVLSIDGSERGSRKFKIIDRVEHNFWDFYGNRDKYVFENSKRKDMFIKINMANIFSVSTVGED